MVSFTSLDEDKLPENQAEIFKFRNKSSSNKIEVRRYSTEHDDKQTSKKLQTDLNKKPRHKISHSYNFSRGSVNCALPNIIDSDNFDKRSDSCINTMRAQEIDFGFYVEYRSSNNNNDCTVLGTIQNTINTSDGISETSGRLDQRLQKKTSNNLKNSIIPEMTDFSSDCKVQTPRENFKQPMKPVRIIRVNSTNEMEKSIVYKKPSYLKKQTGAISNKMIEDDSNGIIDKAGSNGISIRKKERKPLTPKIIYNSKSMHASMIQNDHAKQGDFHDTYQSDSDYYKTQIIDSINRSLNMSNCANQKININISIGNINTKHSYKPSSGSNGYVKSGTFDCIKDISNQVHHYMGKSGNQLYLSRNYEEGNADLYPENPYFGMGASSDAFFQGSDAQPKIDFPDNIVISEGNSSKNAVCCGGYNTKKICIIF